MGSVESYSKCENENCGGSKWEYFHNEESNTFCYRCGSFYSDWREVDEQGNVRLDEKDNIIWKHQQVQGFGILHYRNKKENKVVYDTLLEPLTPEQLATYQLIFEKPSDEQEILFLTELKDGKIIVHLGSVDKIDDKHILTETELYAKYQKECDEEKACASLDSPNEEELFSSGLIELTDDDLPNFPEMGELLLDNLQADHVVVYATDYISRKQYFEDSSIYGWVMIGTANQIQLFHLYLNPSSEKFIFPQEELKGQAFQENLPRCFYELSMNLRESELQKQFEGGMK